MRFSRLISAVGTLLLASSVNAAYTLTVTDNNSIKTTAQQLSKGLMNYYKGNTTGNTPGLLPAPYYWWEAGAMWGALIDYWYLTGDAQWNDIVTQAMLFQVGTSNDFMPANQTSDEGNDDQCFWGVAAMAAAERKFPDPPSTSPQWLALAQAVFNEMAARWDSGTCAGGLRWQIFTFNNGYNYKNTIANGCFFQLAARLGRYTGNTTYTDWATKTWNWMEAVGVMSPDFHTYDGTDPTINCTQVNHIEWTYNNGAVLLGAATMWNISSDPTWKTRVDGIIATGGIFFDNGVMKEVACEDGNTCDVDQQSFKGYLARWWGATMKLAPWTQPNILGLLQASAQAAISTCTGGNDGQQCGLKWTTKAYDGTTGVGEMMAVMEVVQSLLQPTVGATYTGSTGGSSQGNPSAGSGSSGGSSTVVLDPITTADKAGAGILTAIALLTTFAGSYWMIRK